MAYSTQSDIEYRLPTIDLQELTDDSNGSTVDSSILNEAIALADALIDSHLRGKHTTPLSTVPPLVREWSVNLSIYNLYQRRIDLGIPENIDVGYENTLKQLRQVRDNKLMIDDAGSSANTAGYYATSSTSSKRIFTTNDSQSGKLDQYFSACRITSRITGD